MPMNSNNPSILSIGDTVTLDIGAIAHGGHFVARHEGQVIFVRHAITGETAKVKITGLSKKLAFGDAIEIINPSKDRVTAPCAFAKPDGCGGCDFQHIDINAQRELKAKVIQEQFLRLAKMDIKPEVISVEPQSGLHWRTRINFAISKNGKPGFYAAKSKTVVEVDQCLLAADEINSLDIFNRKWRGNDRLNIAVSSLKETNISRGGRSISGPTQLNETFDDFIYKVSPNSFWQGHKSAPKKLVDIAMDFLSLNKGDKVCDLYGGTGLFTAPILKIIGEKGEVHLIESDERAVKDASKIFHKQSNVTLYLGRVENILPLIKTVDVMLRDPPRAGAGELVIDQMLEKKPKTIVYISCDPASLARDTMLLKNKDYNLEKITAVDLFPMTHHIECVAKYNLS